MLEILHIATVSGQYRLVCYTTVPHNYILSAAKFS